jgi:hypothetical protein
MKGLSIPPSPPYFAKQILNIEDSNPWVRERSEASSRGTRELAQLHQDL